MFILEENETKCTCNDFFLLKEERRTSGGLATFTSKRLKTDCRRNKRCIENWAVFIHFSNSPLRENFYFTHRFKYDIFFAYSIALSIKLNIKIMISLWVIFYDLTCWVTLLVSVITFNFSSFLPDWDKYFHAKGYWSLILCLEVVPENKHASMM